MRSPLYVCQRDCLHTSSDLAPWINQPLAVRKHGVCSWSKSYFHPEGTELVCSTQVSNTNGRVVTEGDYGPPCPSTISEPVRKLRHLFLFFIERREVFPVLPVTVSHSKRSFEQIRQEPVEANKLRKSLGEKLSLKLDFFMLGAFLKLLFVGQRLLAREIKWERKREE